VTASEVERGKRVQVVEPAPEPYVGQHGKITSYSRPQSEWWVEVRLDCGDVSDFRLAELIVG